MYTKTTKLFLCLAVAASAQPLPEMRMSPAEVAARSVDDTRAGGSGLATVHTKVLYGDPSKAGFYSIILSVPAGTTIQAHSHRDDRIATVVSGTWHFGYGEHFDVEALKKLPPGSVYSEPGGAHHFARTESEPAILQISGYGPSDTHYFDPANEPMPPAPVSGPASEGPKLVWAPSSGVYAVYPDDGIQKNGAGIPVATPEGFVAGVAIDSMINRRPADYKDRLGRLAANQATSGILFASFR